MNRFLKDMKSYFRYIAYQSKADIKTEVIDSKLGWIWLFLEPLCFMLIYTFIAGTIFHSKENYFPIFVYIGLSLWNFFNKTIIASVRLVSSNRDIVTKVYVPKYILLVEKIFVNFTKMLISFSLVIVFMIIYRVPISWNILFIIPILIVLVVVTFGIGSIFMHFGVFLEDLSNITNIGMRLLFYLTGIFYSVKKKVPAPYNKIILWVNPAAYLVTGARDALLNCKMPSLKIMALWLLIGVLLSIIGINTIYKYENTYVKVMKN